MTADSPEENTIPESEFRVPAHDDKGHSSRLNVRIHPTTSVLLQNILESKQFPFQNTHHIVRLFLKWGIERLENAIPIPNSMFHRTNAIFELLVEEEEQDRFIEVFEKLEKQIGAYLGKSKVKKARVLVQRVFQHVDLMPDGEWKDEYQKDMDEKFGYLLKTEGKNIASLVDLAEE